jgi:hypothetical protein
VYERLPSDIASRQVLLMDPLVGTGRTACRAVEVRCCMHQEHRLVQSNGVGVLLLVGKQPLQSRWMCRGCWRLRT